MVKLSRRFGMGISLLLSMSLPCFACVGARPLSMGGAFIAVADDANAVYWNPAGLTQIAEGSMHTYMDTIAGNINYQWFFSGVEKRGTVAYGLSGINSLNNLTNQEGILVTGILDNTWYQFSLAVALTEDLSFGTNLKFYDAEGVDSRIGYFTGQGTGFDLAVHLQAADNLRIGLLSQDVLGSDIGGVIQMASNVRPGVAWDVDKDTTVAVDIYDLTGASTISAGVERRFPNGALRGGYYHNTWTIGFGLTDGESNSLDYCYIYDSHIVSLSRSF